MTVDIEKLRGLMEKATPGPWRDQDDPDHPGVAEFRQVISCEDRPRFICSPEWPGDAELVAAAHNNLPALLNELEAAKQQNAQARAQRDAEIETVKLLDDEAASLRDQTRCPACGCATPEEAEANECGCNAPVCAIEVPTTLAKAYHDAVEQNAQLTARVEAQRQYIGLQDEQFHRVAGLAMAHGWAGDLDLYEKAKPLRKLLGYGEFALDEAGGA